MRVAAKPPAESRTHWTVPDAAERWQVSERTIFSKIADGEVAVIKFGRATRIPRDEIERIDREGFSPA